MGTTRPLSGTALPEELLVLLDTLEQTQTGGSSLSAARHKLNNLCTDLEPCGSAPLHLLRSVYSILRDPSSSSPARASTLAASLVRLADEKILSYNYKDVPVCWRRMYTDATMLKVVGTFVAESDTAEEEWLQAVRELDMVLIVAGAPGERRGDMVFDLIRLVQFKLPLPISAPMTDVPLRKRARLSPSRLPSPHITTPISRLASPPSLSAFVSSHIHTPFILSAGCTDWPALTSWRDHSYLRALAGRGRVVPVEVGGNYTAEDWGQRIVLFEEFLNSLYPPVSEGGTAKNKQKLYLAQHDLFRQFPELARDVIVPDYVYSAPETSEESPYRPPPNEDGYVMNAWLGPGGTLSPAHTDPYYNCYGESLLFYEIG
jgi:hypothetical protein